MFVERTITKRYSKNMSGHNKWAQIKRQKGANDAAKSNVWGKLSRRITIEVKKAGGKDTAPAVRTLIETARASNMPKDAIERAVQKGQGIGADTFEAITYEAYGPGGAAIIIETLTDSRNRTAQEMKHLLSENGIALATQGSALWAFDKTFDGYTPKSTVELSDEDGAALMKILTILDANDDVQEVYTNAA